MEMKAGRQVITQCDDPWSGSLSHVRMNGVGEGRMLRAPGRDDEWSRLAGGRVALYDVATCLQQLPIPQT
jgi:hypothetical protein